MRAQTLILRGILLIASVCSMGVALLAYNVRGVAECQDVPTSNGELFGIAVVCGFVAVGAAFAAGRVDCFNSQ